ncbi:hypothetical protein EFR94_06610 [Levilactobacillus brevis]|uniref:hypothetical protein n=1 Tax=Levilactobacillus brevis TaxID=1580 RepID=UPI0021A95430|nr:hypothetical protein [Levilactobacillus brevis]MCT3567054.1 hypothetical protein [Levilactobacillus brevis]
MAFLLTYPRSRVALDLQQRLASTQPTVYCPCRVLQAMALTEKQQRLIQSSSDLILTSQFGLHVYLAHWATLNLTATIHVLSQKMANQLRQRVSNPIVVAATESQQGFLSQLLALGHDRQRCWLVGDRAKRLREFSLDVTVVIYENQWPIENQQIAVQKLAGQHFSRVLITSPSNFEGLRAVQQRLSATAFVNADYYVLGTTSATVVRQARLPVIMPTEPHDVLRQMISRMCQD